MNEKKPADTEDAKGAAQSERCSLHSLQPSPWRSWCCLSLLVANCGVVLFSHIALAIVIETNLPRTALDAANMCIGPGRPARLLLDSDVCNEADLEIWLRLGNKTNDKEGACGLDCGTATMAGTECVTECMQKEGYSLSCAACFGDRGKCAAENCFMLCLPPNHMGVECKDCGIKHCGWEDTGDFGKCHGMGPWRGTDVNSRTTSAAPGITTSTAAEEFASVGDVGELAFWDGVEKSWEGDAYALAILVFIASGINPYLENILLMVVFFAPLTSRKRQRLLWFVNRFGRWTFVDVFCVAIIVCAVNFWCMGGQVHVRSMTKPGIYAFAIATIWARIQGAQIEKIHHTAKMKAVEGHWTNYTVKPLHLRIHATLTLLLLFASIFVKSFRFTVTDPNIDKTTTDDYALIDLAVPKDANEMYDGAEMLGPILMGFTLYVFTALLPLGQHIALIIWPGWPALLKAVDRIGSATSLDVLVISAAIVIPYFGSILNQATECWTPEGFPPAVKAEGQMLWGGFTCMVLCAISEFALIEVVSIAADRPAEAEASAAVDWDATADQSTAGEAKEVSPTMIGEGANDPNGDKGVSQIAV